MWLYQGLEFTEDMVEDYEGFVYVITNNTNGKKYIGRKFFTFSKTKYKVVTQKNGIKKKKKLKSSVESDWVDYYGSSKLLLADIELLGKEKFTREIIMLCSNRSQCSYYESKEIFTTDAILSDQFYNDYVQCRISGNHLRFTRKKIP